MKKITSQFFSLYTIRTILLGFAFLTIVYLLHSQASKSSAKSLAGQVAVNVSKSEWGTLMGKPVPVSISVPGSVAGPLIYQVEFQLDEHPGLVTALVDGRMSFSSSRISSWEKGDKVLVAGIPSRFHDDFSVKPGRVFFVVSYRGGVTNP